jgi:glycosyltransferase involved in cell wall biosynthesis
MRILIANEARQGAGGVETYLSSLVPHLEARGHAVALLYANPSGETGPTRIVTNEAWSVADEGVDLALAGARAWHPDVCFSHNMRRLDVDEQLAAAWPTFKMMHGYFGACVSGHKAFSFPALEPCTRTCGPGCLVYYLPRNCGQLRVGVMMEQYSRARRQQRLFRKYAGIVVASDHMRREYLRYDIPPEAIHAIPLFTAPPRTPVAASREPRIDVLFLGRMTPLKGGAFLIDALDRAARALGRPLEAVLAGEGPERERLRQLARERSAGGALTVEFPGWVADSARAALFARSSLVAIPSIWPEPFGLVGLEAAHFGVPAVAFDVGGIPQWLTDDVNGRLVDLRGGAPALGAAIAAVLADPSAHARLSAGARAAASRFNADPHVTRLEQIMETSQTSPVASRGSQSRVSVD